MRDDERGAAGEQRRHRRLNQLLAFDVEIAGRLVQDQNLRRRPATARAIASRCCWPPDSFTPRSPTVVSYLRQALDELVGVGAPGGVLDSDVGGVRRP